MSDFNKESDYDIYIAEHVKEVVSLCYKHKIPMFFTAAVVNSNDSDTEYVSEYISAKKVNINLSEDKLSGHINVANGFETVLPKELDEFEL